MCRNEGKNIVICGVGGQGIVLFGKILGEFYKRKGCELKISDIVGLGQRGGSVICHFRYSEQPIHSPLIKAGDVDFLISFEQTETLRNMHYMQDNGVIFTSTFELSSPSVNADIEKDIVGDKTLIIKEAWDKTYILDAAEYGDLGVDLNLMSNIVMLGLFASYMGYDDLELIDVMKENINPNFIDSNIKAFELGKQIFEGQRALH